MGHISPMRNLVVALTCMGFALGLLSLGGARVPWTSVSYTGLNPNGPSTLTQLHAVSFDIGVLRTETCDFTCSSSATDTFGASCDGIGKGTVFFISCALAVSLGSVLTVLFASLKRGLSGGMFLLSSLFYGAALVTWASGCHKDINDGTFTIGAVTPIDFTKEYAIGFGAVIASSISTLAAMVFMCCSPDE